MARQAVVRRLERGEESAFVRSVFTPFLDPITDEADRLAEAAAEEQSLEVDRAWVAEDDGRIVANARIESLDVTVPAAAGQDSPVLPMAGVSSVGVHPTHRRQGLLTKMMVEMLADARSRGEPLAGLIASEAPIYGRFGFGHATDMAELSIDSRASAFAVEAPSLDLRLIDADEAAKVLPELYDRQRRGRAGEPSRRAPRWAEILADRPRSRGGAGAVFRAACDEGYVAYRAHEAMVLRGERVRVVIEELRGTTPAVEAGLWRFVLDIDLVGEVVARRRPTDEPLRFRLADPRQLRTVSVDDRLYVRVLDVPTALAGRGYQIEGRIVLEIVAEADDPAAGRFVLDAGPEGASCTLAKDADAPEIRLGLRELGSMYMGGVAASSLAAAGRLEELAPGALKRADLLFTTRPAPLTGTGF
jgi:predicted acetyltransferase